MAKIRMQLNNIRKHNSNIVKVKQVNLDSWRSGKTTAERGYGGRWQRLRLVFLNKNPLCVYCKANGKVTAANVVDHIEPHKGDQSLFWNEANWQALCSYCHDNIKKKEELLN